MHRCNGKEVKRISREMKRNAGKVKRIPEKMKRNAKELRERELLEKLYRLTVDMAAGFERLIGG